MITHLSYVSCQKVGIHILPVILFAAGNAMLSAKICLHNLTNYV